jgi:hypothetical protein
VGLFKWFRDALSGNYVAGNVMDGFVINPGHSLKLTIKGVNEAQAKQFKDLLDKDVKGGSSLDALANMIHEYGITCPKVDAYIAGIRPEFEEGVEALKAKSAKWKKADEDDRELLEEDFQDKVISKYDFRESTEDAVMTLLLGYKGSERAIARLILTTYTTSERVIKALAEAKRETEPEFRYTISGCCNQCRTHERKRSKTVPENLPPFRIGCGCHLNHEPFY